MKLAYAGMFGSERQHLVQGVMTSALMAASTDLSAVQQHRYRAIGALSATPAFTSG
jgi:hypothetical protein